MDPSLRAGYMGAHSETRQYHTVYIHNREDSSHFETCAQASAAVPLLCAAVEPTLRCATHNGFATTQSFAHSRGFGRVEHTVLCALKRKSAEWRRITEETGQIIIIFDLLPIAFLSLLYEERIR